ncbi:hypothetical protein NDU88_003191 [Pleurodeles waltl]|uniref:Uncharacterized protein n=1 Tax=Pleurodeles waltl TaxID=8319 RepID=A0AAV7NG49_PLEWA|nr:hypothetical protein NDU88_003191 [Pleurodeles waltl]
MDKRRRAPQEDLSAAFALEPRSSFYRSRTTPAVSWGKCLAVERPDGAEAYQDTSLLTSAAESRPRGSQKGKKTSSPQLEGAQYPSQERAPAEDIWHGKGRKELGSKNVCQHYEDQTDAPGEGST